MSPISEAMSDMHIPEDENLLNVPDAAAIPCKTEIRAGLDRSDVRRISEIERLSFTDPWPEISFEDIAEGKKDCIFITAYSDGEPSGFGCMYTVLDEAHIMNIAAAPDCRRRGVASMIMDALISDAISKGVSVMMLEVRESNQAAIGLYKKYGFEEVGVRKNYYRKPTENAILMNKDL